MSFEIKVNKDETVEYVSRFKKGRSSLSAMGAEYLAGLVNKLDKIELFAVAWSIRKAPFPLGAGAEIYSDVLQTMQHNLPELKEKEKGVRLWFDQPLGEIRKAFVLRYCGGCNAPGDSYLKIAVAHKEGVELREAY